MPPRFRIRCQTAVLRELNQADGADLYEVAGSPLVAEHVPFGLWSDEETIQQLGHMIAAQSE